MVNRKLVLAVCGAAALAVMLAPRAGAMGDSKTTYVTFSQPVSLPGVALGSGTYIFEIANPDTSANVVRVMSRDRRIAYFMGFTHAVSRPHDLDRKQSVSLGESAAGVAPPITTWWPQDDSTGRQFVYPDVR
jgi:hypothetical protein